MIRVHSLPMTLTVLLVWGCSSSSNQAGASNNGGATATCAAGSERCACYANGTCDKGLNCYSNVCVQITSSASGGGGAGVTGGAGGLSSGGSGISSAGHSSIGGATGVPGGGASTAGGTLAAGGTSATAGATSMGGASTTGGVTNVGGASAIGGFSSGGASTGTAASGGVISTGGAPGAGGATGGGSGIAGSAGTGGGTSNAIPVTCADASTAQSHFGCEFWPTVTPNPVWSIFDFAVIVVNPGTSTASLTVSQGTTTTSDSVAAKSAKILYLPWVPSLKGSDFDSCGALGASGGSVRATGGAYRLVSSAPVAVYQHSPVEQQPVGGPANKVWTTCPANQCSLQCLALTSDSSLLLPTSSLGTTYRAAGPAGWQVAGLGPYLTVTGTSNTTKVTVTPSDALNAGGGIVAQSAGNVFDFMLDQGEVVILQAPATANLAGTLLTADKPIQVVSGISCAQVPVGTSGCDHLEDSLLPAQALGKHYVIPVPRGPNGDQPGHVVQFVGHNDGTALTYSGNTPPGAPMSLNAGQVISMGLVTQAFEVQGDKTFAAVSYIPGGGLLDPNPGSQGQLGDPSLRVLVPVEQFRNQYAVAAAPNYVASHFEVVVPIGAQLKLDGTAVSGAPAAFGGGGFGVIQLPADSTTTDYHLLEADQPFGLQIIGYGYSSSYAHPGGTNVKSIP